MPINLSGVLPPTNDGGLVNPFNNALGGIGMMYGVAGANQDLEQGAISNATNRNTLENLYADNPVKQAQRGLALSEAGVQQGLYNSGGKKELAQTALAADTEAARAKSSTSRLEQQVEHAEGILQAQSMMDSFNTQNPGAGQMEKASFWKENIAPHFNTYKIKGGEEYSPKAEQNLAAHVPGATQTRAFAQQMLMEKAKTGSAERIAEIGAGASKYTADTQYKIHQDFPSMDNRMGNLVGRASAGQATPKEIEILDAYFTGRLGIGRVMNDSIEVKLAIIQANGAKQDLEADPKNPEKQKAWIAAEAAVEKARQDSMYKSQPQAPQPGQPPVASPQPQPAPTPVPTAKAPPGAVKSRLVNGVIQYQLANGTIVDANGKPIGP